MQYWEIGKILQNIRKSSWIWSRTKTKIFPQFCNIEKLAKISKKLEKVVEFDLEEKEKFPIIVFVKKK